MQPDAPDPSAPRFGKYVIAGKLGAGGMGEVWKAYDTQLDRWIALKFLLDGVGTQAARFKREAQMAARLTHPGIAAVYEVGEEGGRHYIAMQFVAGKTLAPGEPRRITVERLRDAARAVQYAHDHGVIHRDLKPANIMWDGQRTYVMDFGLAREVDTKSSLSMTGMMVGTPAYMSPEQARGEHADARSDVYGLGVTMYEVIAGRAAFAGETILELLMAVSEEEPAPMAIDRDLDAIAAKCLEKIPARRYATAGAFADDLQRWLDGEPIEARRTSTVRRVFRKAGRNRAAVIATAGLVTVAIAAIVALSVQGARAGRRQQALQRLTTLAATIVERKQELRQGRTAVSVARDALRQAVLAMDSHIAEYPNEPPGYFVRARGRFYLGDRAGAQLDLREALRRVPDFKPAWSLLGAVQLDEYERARRALEGPAGEQSVSAILVEATRSIEKGGQAETAQWGLPHTRDDDVAQRILRALHARHVARDADRALRILDEALAEYRSEEYLSLLGSWTADPATALKLQSMAIDFAPGYARARDLRGDLRQQAGDHAGAIEDYTAAIEIVPDDAWPLTKRGTSRKELREFNAAIADHDRALALRSDFPEALVNRALAKKLKGDTSGAMADYDAALALRPNLSAAFNNRGTLKNLLGDCAGAIADYDRALASCPTAADTLVNRSLARRESGDAAGAMRDIEQAMALRPDYVDALFARANLNADRRQYEPALADLNRVLDLRPTYPEALVNRGSARKALGDKSGAVADFTRAIELRPGYAAAYFNRGNSKRESREYKGAEADYTQAIEAKPDYLEAYANRGQARRSLGDSAGAISDYEHVLRESPPDWPWRGKVEGWLRATKGE